ncbi:peptidylprolyl isomerase [Flectobacillus major]|uniref:peptidylprolyl isomerase n=1 Tax=Flectobacillus major TaxID=103 RepID=UPI000412CE2B|nr:peptidylprolyl isomerase [Flectobacillus major]
MNKIFSIYTALIASLSIIAHTGNAQNDAQAITIGTKKISSYELEQTYKKFVQSDSIKKENYKTFLQDFIDYKLAVYAAERLGLDTTKAFVEELNTYRKELTSPYLTDKNVLDKLVQEAYDRMKEEVRIAQIFLPIAKNASPADTMAVYDEIRSLRVRITRGESFEQIAKDYSKDTKSAVKGGDLGYLAVLDNNYTFESAAYNTPKGEVSLPIRTDRGYHLIKVLDKRSFRGKVKLAHILVSQSANMSDTEKIAAKKKIDEAYAFLKKGEPFDGVCRTYSDDVSTKSRGGVLSRWYEAGTLIDEKITDLVFSLKEKGDYTTPIQTSLGWHIFRLVEKKGLLKFEELAPFIRQKISSDPSRGAIAKSNLVKRLIRENNYLEYISVKQEAFDKFYKDRLGNEGYLSKAIFTINSQPFTIKDFYDFVVQQQRQLIKVGGLNDKSVGDWYNTFVEQKNLEYEEANVEVKHPEFKAVLQEYREGILQKNMIDRYVLAPSLDSIAQVRYFQQNAPNYQYTNRLLAKVITADRRETLEQAKSVLQKGPYPMNRRFPEIYFEKDKAEFSADAQKILYELALIMIKNRDYTVEIAGNSDPDEQESVSAERARNIVNSLINKGVSATRVIEKDEGKYKPVSKTDRSKNMRATIKFYSTSMEDVVKRFNALKANSLTAEEKFFKKGENEIVDLAAWTVGEQSFEVKNRHVWMNVEKVEEPRAKTFKEARGQVIRDYQKTLLDNWLGQLKAKYPVSINENEIKRIFE